MILLDYSSVMMSSIMVRINEFDNDPALVRHQILNTIRMYNKQFREEFGEMVLCLDSKDSWRRQKYPFYKANRRKNRKESSHDWAAIYSMLNTVEEEFRKYAPFKMLKVDGAEADDIIGAICAEAKEPILIVSPDKDFIQLQRYGNVKQYSNLQKKWVEPDSLPMMDLEVKILKGDTGDGVPNVLSDDNVLTEGKRQTPLSKKKITALMENPESLGVSTARRIIRNRDLIDLSRTPEEIKQESLRQLRETESGSMVSLMTLFTKHQMKLLMEDLSDFEINK